MSTPTARASSLLGERSLLVAALVAISGLSGCGSSGAAPPRTRSVTAEAVKMTPAPRTAAEAVGQRITFHKPPLYVEQIATYPAHPRLIDVRLSASRLCAMSVPQRRAALEQTLRPVLAAARARHVHVRVSRISDTGAIRYVWAVSSGRAITLTSGGRARGARCGA
jgi:hypothetical protein